MILYTSGTTNRPKGVVTTHGNITAQILSLVEAWEWSADDRILLFLPLHHVHGIINVVSCALWSGATCQMLERFDANAVWDLIADGNINFVHGGADDLREAHRCVGQRFSRTTRVLKPGVRKIALDGVRIGSAAGEHFSTLEGNQRAHAAGTLRHDGDWHGARRIRCAAGACQAASGRRCRALRFSLSVTTASRFAAGTPGEIEVRGPNVFAEYWGKPDATREAFRDGWFRTGDTASVENGRYRILGRTSVDILKTGGHKVSALEIEEALREHPAVAECAVVGVPDPEWGERVAAAVVLNRGDAS